LTNRLDYIRFFCYILILISVSSIQGENDEQRRGVNREADERK
jgi:hypothetical protein